MARYDNSLTDFFLGSPQTFQILDVTRDDSTDGKASTAEAIVLYPNSSSGRRQQHHRRPYEPTPSRPPLDSLVQGWNVTGDPQWLLNFAIVGFPKCGTSTLMHNLYLHPEVQIFPHEECSMSGNQHVPLIRKLYQNYSVGDYVRGIKCPRELESNNVALPNYANFFPATDFIIGLRHPVLWFQSFYNHRVRNGRLDMLPPSELMGWCKKGSRGVCSDRANYHEWLAHLGKTAPQSQEELDEFFPKYMHNKQLDGMGWKGRVFLYDVEQLNDPSTRRDLHDFLELDKEIPPFVWYRPGNNKKTADDSNSSSTASLQSRQLAAAIEERILDICHPNHTAVRTELVRIGKLASNWILRYFIASTDVFVTNLPMFRQHLMDWQRDPCGNTTNIITPTII